MSSPNRNGALSALLISLAVAGCTTTTSPSTAVTQPLERQRPAAIASYSAQTDDKLPVSAIDVSKLDPKNMRQQVDHFFKDGKDTLFRIHGTNEPETIGHAVSSGCIRMMNQDVIDLHRRVPSGSKVMVI